MSRITRRVWLVALPALGLAACEDRDERGLEGEPGEVGDTMLEGRATTAALGNLITEPVLDDAGERAELTWPSQDEVLTTDAAIQYCWVVGENAAGDPYAGREGPLFGLGYLFELRDANGGLHRRVFSTLTDHHLDQATIDALAEAPQPLVATVVHAYFEQDRVIEGPFAGLPLSHRVRPAY